MLPPANRLRRSTDFSSAVRGGSRARTGRLVLHQQAMTGHDTESVPRVGLIVGKAVGGSVVRHRVSRRLRAQLAGRLDRLPQHSITVVRALPGCADVTSDSLGRDLDRALRVLEQRR